MTTKKRREWSTEEADAIIAEIDMRPRTPHEDDMAILLAELVLDARADLAEAQQEIARLQKLAFIGEHHFDDLTYKVRLEELVTQHFPRARLEGAIEALSWAASLDTTRSDFEERLAELRVELERLK